jgi:hypothetical protein
MKLLLENWRKYVTERVDYPIADWPKRKPTKNPFEKITFEDIVNNRDELQSEKLAILRQMEALVDPAITDPKGAAKNNNILISLFQMSGNSEDFNFKNKEEAATAFLEPRWQDPTVPGQLVSLKNIYEKMKKTSPVFSYPPEKNI